MDWIVVGILLLWLAVGFLCWLCLQLLRQNGRILLQLESLAERLEEPPAPRPAPSAPRLPAGLAVGTPAPEFALPALTGERVTLDQFRGREIVLIFFDPRCGFCRRMATDLAALPVAGVAGRPLPLIISAGDAEENRRFFQEHGIGCPVLLQEEREVAARYLAHGTPVGYRIDGEGRIASALAVGAAELLALAEAPAAPADRNGHARHRGNRDLADSKLNRDGLPAGTPAPGFTLPDLAGGERSLAEYRGRRVLLVFSDPACGPCNELLPHLERFHRRAEETAVLMVSRGDPEANRAKAAEHGLTFPILLQRQWEVSRQYAMFATPIAYRIDAAGVVAGDVAVGVESILGLLPAAGERRCRCGKRSIECPCHQREPARAR